MPMATLKGRVDMKKTIRILVLAAIILSAVLSFGCGGGTAYVGVSVPVGYYPYNGWGPYGAYGPYGPHGGYGPYGGTVGVTVPIGKPYRY
jgi:hypothetical protein